MLAGITTVVQLKVVQQNDLLELMVQCSGIFIDTLRNWRDIPCHDGTYLHTKIDHRTAANLYISKYGDNQWREECEDSVFMKYICII